MKMRGRARKELEFEVRTVMRRWLNGGPALPYIQLLVDAERFLEAAATSRLALADPNCLDRSDIEAIELVEDGLVRPETILARNEESTGAKAFFLGLAAEAAFLRGDMVGTIRMLREAYSHADEWCSPDFAVLFIRGRATDEQNALLDNAGIPRL